MKIVCVGGGPAGLYLSILARLWSGGRDEVVLVERNAPGTASGFAVTLGEDILDELYRTDPVGADRVRAAAHVWDSQVVEIAGRTVHLGGRYGYSIGRSRLLEVLAERARQVGVRLHFETAAAADGDTAADPLTADADVVVAADGVGSAIRQRRTDAFGTRVAHGANRYVWFGTTKAFRPFTFAFERTAAGWIWFHAYPAADCVSTCIVECTPETWTGLGLDAMDPQEAMRFLERIFERSLDGHSLIAPPGMGASPWLTFREVRNMSWRDGEVVLLGDAAHTTHFAIGSGTVLAVADAIALAEELYPGGLPGTDDVEAALAGYDARRRATMAPIQRMARRSMEWFETVPQRLDGTDPIDFAWSLLDRRGDQGRLHRRLHDITQIEPVREVRRRLTTARRVRRAVGRGEIGRSQAPSELLNG
ncbi:MULTISPECIES: FAD-dependent monooxygenase [unclassified Pseudonocardia]|uniref:FAD-dependent monooxygenase n=1 Tax=unclassified Pseudonocardia TaxID=2619320 RepID=UPI0001FFE027|nr:FAD-dependent monooxygenase [Pseudonocardia sp. Ae707_Ps1]OLM18089.1 putative hydroxylase [Pseudonocardia sp. Ae707_Ps1]